MIRSHRSSVCESAHGRYANILKRTNERTNEQTTQMSWHFVSVCVCVIRSKWFKITPKTKVLIGCNRCQLAEFNWNAIWSIRWKSNVFFFIQAQITRCMQKKKTYKKRSATDLVLKICRFLSFKRTEHKNQGNFKQWNPIVWSGRVQQEPYDESFEIISLNWWLKMIWLRNASFAWRLNWPFGKQLSSGS